MKYTITTERSETEVEAIFLPTGTGYIGGAKINIYLAFDINRLRLAIVAHADTIIELMTGLLRKDQKILVITHVYKLTGWGLKDSESFVDAWMEDLGL